MSIKVIKRDGKIEKFDTDKIKSAIGKSFRSVWNQINPDMIEMDDKCIGQWEDLECDIVDTISNELEIRGTVQVTVEDIQDLVIKYLKANKDAKIGSINIADEYINYRLKRTRIREKKSDLMMKVKSISVETDRDNANVGNNFSAKLLRIASESNKASVLSQMMDFDEEMADLHISGAGHIHDLDSFNLTVNCLHIPAKKLLKNGFNTGYGKVTTPKRIITAAELLCILLQNNQNV